MRSIFSDSKDQLRIDDVKRAYDKELWMQCAIDGLMFKAAGLHI